MSGWGGGYVTDITYMTGYYRQQSPALIALACLLGGVASPLPGLSEEQADKVAAKFAKFIGLGFEQDVEIWTHKTRVDNPLLCSDDGPVYQLRRWYEQFYTDVEDITPQMVERYEFEVDTTRAVAEWETEVAANLAGRQDGAR